MRALVTGGAGFIGSALARALVDRGWSVRVLDNLSTGRADRVTAEAELVVGDVRDDSAVRDAARGMEIVFHQAAIRSVGRSIEEPRLANACNVDGTLNVLQAATDAGVRRVVYASSSSVYGDCGRPINREDDPPGPMSPYAVGKLAGEQYCRVWSHVRGLSTVSLRYFNVFGPGQETESRYAAVFPAFVSALMDGRSPEVHWDGEQTRDFTFVEDVVQANVLAAEVGPAVDGAVFNIGGGRSRSVNEVLEGISLALGTWIEPVHAPGRAGDIRHTRADISRARSLLGWEPSTSWERAVERTVRWFAVDRISSPAGTVACVT